MAWNDIDWMSASQGGGFMANQRADEAASLRRDELSTQQNQFTQRQAEQRREFDVSTTERQREFDAQTPARDANLALLKIHLEAQANQMSDSKMFEALQSWTNAGNDPTQFAGAFKTPMYNAAAEQFVSKTAVGMRLHSIRTNTDIRVAKLDDDGYARWVDEAVFNRGVPTKDSLDVLKEEEARIERENDARELAKRTELYRSTTLEGIRERGDIAEEVARIRMSNIPGVSDALDANGNVVAKHFIDEATGKPVPGWTAVPTRYGWRAIQSGPKGDEQVLTPSQNISRLNAMFRIEESNLSQIAGNKSAAAVKAKKEIEGRMAEISNELKAIGKAPTAAPSASSAPPLPAAPALRFNPDTGLYE